MFSFGIKDIIDILIVALLLYTLYKMMKESGTISIFTGVLAFVGVWIVAEKGRNCPPSGAGSSATDGCGPFFQPQSWRERSWASFSTTPGA